MRFVIYVFALLTCSFCWSQSSSGNGKNKIELLGANKLKGGTFHGRKINKLIGNVKFRHAGTLMYCDSAYQFLDKNEIEAYSNIRILKGDSTRLYGDKLNYFGDTKYAKMRKNVRLIDGSRTLTTEFLDFDMANDMAYYFDGGRLIDKGTRLVSRQGAYNTRSKFYSFKDSVVLRRQEYTLECDTLDYNGNSKIAYFHGPTELFSRTKHLYAEKGQYHTLSEKSYFKINAKVRTSANVLQGDSLYYDNVTDFGYAVGNVFILNKKDSLTITGEEGFRSGSKGMAKVFGHPIMRKVDRGDTLYVTADTLVSIEDTVRDMNRLQAYYNVQMFRNEIQGKCDSMLYEFSDSVIYFQGNPVLWNGENQITADTLTVTMANGELDKMYADVNAYIVSQENPVNYNQIKGRNMIAHFRENDLQKVDINGNGESLYFAYNEKDEFLGMNKVICSDMLVFFEENELQNISFLTAPDANFIPLHEIMAPEKRLKGFKWREKERPTIEGILGEEKTPNASKPKENNANLEDLPPAEEELSRKEKRIQKRIERQKEKESSN